MTRFKLSISATLLLITLMPAALMAQDPGFDKPSPTASSPGFDTNINNFDVDTIKVKNARLDLNNSDDQDYLKKHHGLSLKPNEAIAFKGIFASPNGDSPQLLVIDLSKDQLELYEGSSRRIRHKDLGLISTKEMEKLNLKQRVLLTQTTNTNTMDLLLWQKSSSKSKTSYNMSVVKVFGNYFGRPFTHKVATSKKDADTITPTAQVSVYKKNKSLVFGVKSAKNSTETLYIWDKWSGTFANPLMAPKAPAKPQS